MRRPQSRPYVEYVHSLRPCLTASSIRLATSDHHVRSSQSPQSKSRGRPVQSASSRAAPSAFSAVSSPGHGSRSELVSRSAAGSPSSVSSIRACSSLLKSGWFSNVSSSRYGSSGISSSRPELRALRSRWSRIASAKRDSFSTMGSSRSDMTPSKGRILPNGFGPTRPVVSWPHAALPARRSARSLPLQDVAEAARVAEAPRAEDAPPARAARRRSGRAGGSRASRSSRAQDRNPLARILVARKSLKASASRPRRCARPTASCQPLGSPEAERLADDPVLLALVERRVALARARAPRPADVEHLLDGGGVVGRLVEAGGGRGARTP